MCDRDDGPRLDSRFATPGRLQRAVTRGTALVRGCLLLMLAVVLFAGCASVPKDYPRQPSTAFPDHASTAIGAYFETAAAAHPGQSGFAILPDGSRAFTARIAMTELAEKTLDLQYFIWDADTTGRILAERLVRAADRGVRVRILVDDLNLQGRDAVLAALDAHPNIEVRLFNPFAHRSARLLDFIVDFDRVNHRMHNKLFVMDNAVAIVGGRNIGNHYFEVHQQVNFRDMDVVAGGPVVREASGVFDHFWNSVWAVPIRAMVDRPATEADLRAAVQTSPERVAQEPYPYPLDQDVASLKSELDGHLRPIHLGAGPYDLRRPERDNKIRAHDHDDGRLLPAHRAPQQRVADRGALSGGPQTGTCGREAFARPGCPNPDTDQLPGLQRRAGRPRRPCRAPRRARRGRRGALRAACRPAGQEADLSPLGRRPVDTACKVIVFDRKDVFIGSLNLDPRSGDINTEAGLYIESPELAAQVIAYMDEGVLPQNSLPGVVGRER